VADKIPGGKLTVVIRDDSPAFFSGDTPRYRTVRIQLTKEQRAQIALHPAWTNGNDVVYEVISKCIMEPDDG
jgi:hypothetical protein